MLPKKNRITAPLFYSLRSPVQKASNPLFLLTVKQIPLSTDPKITIIISKKTAPLSTRRNKTRRLIQEAVKEIIPSLKQNTALLIKSRKALQKEKPKDLIPYLKDALESLNLINDQKTLS